MTKEQENAIKCAYADLVGAYQNVVIDIGAADSNGHDWDSHLESIHDLEKAFPTLIEPVNLENEQEEEESSLSM